jgi:hypothetical protein
MTCPAEKYYFLFVDKCRRDSHSSVYANVCAALSAGFPFRDDHAAYASATFAHNNHKIGVNP